MTQHPVCCRTSDSAQSVAKALRDEDVGSIPVIPDADSPRLVGIITDRDLCCTIIAQGLDPATTEVEVVAIIGAARSVPDSLAEIKGTGRRTYARRR